jgi:hypothetical protein
MTHDELLAKIKTGNEFAGIKYAPDSHTFALRAVVELHKPTEMIMPHGAIYCMGCGRDHEFDAYWIEYPCETIKAIEKELE